MRPDILLKTDKTSLLLEAHPDGKMGVNAAAWTDPKVLLPDQLLEVCWNGNQLYWCVGSGLADPDVDPKPYHFDYISDASPAERDE